MLDASVRPRGRNRFSQSKRRCVFPGRARVPQLAAAHRVEGSMRTRSGAFHNIPGRSCEISKFVSSCYDRWRTGQMWYSSAKSWDTYLCSGNRAKPNACVVVFPAHGDLVPLQVREYIHDLLRYGVLVFRVPVSVQRCDGSECRFCLHFPFFRSPS